MIDVAGSSGIAARREHRHPRMIRESTAGWSIDDVLERTQIGWSPNLGLSDKEICWLGTDFGPMPNKRDKKDF